MKALTLQLGVLLTMLVTGLPAMAVDMPTEVTLIQNVNIFDGKYEKLLKGHDVLVVNGLIKAIGEDIPTSGTYEVDVKTGTVRAQEARAPGSLHTYDVVTPGKTETKHVKVHVIDGGGRTLMPGLIDAHWHLMLSATKGNSWQTEQPDYAHARMVVESGRLLQRGFTTIRDIAGPGFGIKKAIDEGLIDGPRIYPSGAMISQTSGHADRTQPFEEPRVFSGRVPVGEGILKMDHVVNGPAEMLAAVRQNLKQGATQIKLALGGGVYSFYDPIDVTELTDTEIKAAVDAASDWGTYVTAHVYTAKGIQRGIRNGLKTIEHGQLMDEKTAKLMSEKGIFLVTQPFEDDPNLRALATDVQWEKYMQVVEGWKITADLLKKYKVKMGFGTDLVFTPENNGQQGDFLARFSTWFSNVEMLRMITSTNDELMALSGKVLHRRAVLARRRCLVRWHCYGV